MGRARNPGVRSGPLRGGAEHRDRARGYDDRPAAGAAGAMMAWEALLPLRPELALLALAIAVLVIGLIRQGNAERLIGWIAFLGIAGIFGFTFFVDEGSLL